MALLIATLAAALVQTATVPLATVRVTGRVTIEGASTPIAGARVTIYPAAPRIGMFAPPPQIMTDQDGRFVFENVAVGEYRLDVQRTGFAPLNPDFGRGPTIRVAGDKAVETVDVQLERGAVITGRVLDASGVPVPDLQMMALRLMNPGVGAPRFIPTPISGMNTTNDIGEFRIHSLSPGEYYIAATRPPSSPVGGPGVPASARGTAVATTYYPGTVNQAAAQPIRVGQGETVANIEFAIQSTAAFAVSGLVVDQNDQPVAGAMVMLIADSRSGAFMGPMGHAQTGEDGRFSIGEVPSGTYNLSASIPIAMGGSGAVAWASSLSIAKSGGGGGVVESSGGPVSQAVEVVVTDASVSGVRVTVRR